MNLTMDFGLANLNKRYVFHATIQEYSLDSEWSKTKQDNVWKPIIKLSNIYCQAPTTGLFEFAGNDAKISYTKSIAGLGQLISGEVIEFKARYVGGAISYSSLGQLMNPSKFRIVKPLIKQRYPVPYSEYLRVGYVMEVNRDKLLNSNMYDQEIVDQYDDWCDTNVYKKNSAADQSNAKS